MKRIYALEAWCVGCKRCEVACKTFHSRSKDAVTAFLHEQPTPRARVRVEGDLMLSAAVNCRHCDEPKCVEGCISGAMRKDPVTGVVTCDQSKCVGCRTCMSMCPYGCVSVQDAGGRLAAFKCDLCGDGAGTAGEPSCVAACPNRALIYVESEGCEDGR
ncbi:MAG TPA: 4Fe-4S dicluster domain-containing protein [Candidatus Aphodovivens avistercoris]|nr:4Fe-4S dicluster domain-containing protein [Candidatus Aphodovivens avistercoris]